MAARGNYEPGQGPKPEIYRVACDGEPKVEGQSYPPVEYSAEVCAEICERLMMGQTLRQISAIVGFPGRKVIYNWRLQHPEFGEAVDKAIEIGCDAIADECIEIADDSRNDYIKRRAYNGDEEKLEVNGEVINRSRVRIDSRKWYVGKKSRRWAEKQQLEHSTADGAPMESKLTIEFVRPPK